MLRYKLKSTGHVAIKPLTEKEKKRNEDVRGGEVCETYKVQITY